MTRGDQPHRARAKERTKQEAANVARERARSRAKRLAVGKKGGWVELTWDSEWDDVWAWEDALI